MFVDDTIAAIATPIGDMLALASAEGLCALEFIGPRERMTRLDARLQRWFPPHEIVEHESEALSRTRAWPVCIPVYRQHRDGAQIGALE